MIEFPSLPGIAFLHAEEMLKQEAPGRRGAVRRGIEALARLDAAARKTPEGLVPDVLLGTHFFNDLVEMQVLYLAAAMAAASWRAVYHCWLAWEAAAGRGLPHPGWD